jgi:hypothetical protein
MGYAVCPLYVCHSLTACLAGRRAVRQAQESALQRIAPVAANVACTDSYATLRNDNRRGDRSGYALHWPLYVWPLYVCHSLTAVRQAQESALLRIALVAANVACTDSYAALRNDNRRGDV